MQGCQDPECNRLVTVCKSCKMAACWRGIFMCDDAQGADTERLPVWKLRALGLEHSDHYAAKDDYPEPEPNLCSYCKLADPDDCICTL